MNNDSDNAVVNSTTTLGATEVDVDDNTQLGISLTYMLSNQVGVEVLAATPFEHDVTVLSGDVAALNGFDLASVTHLPPTVSVQYFPMGGSDSKFQPYVGAGVNYTIFFDEELSAGAKSVLGGSKISLESSLGLAVQAGIDYQLQDNWLVNASIMYADINTEATVDADGSYASIQKITVDTELDPWVYRVNVGYQF